MASPDDVCVRCKDTRALHDAVPSGSCGIFIETEGHCLNCGHLVHAEPCTEDHPTGMVGACGCDFWLADALARQVDRGPPPSPAGAA